MNWLSEKIIKYRWLIIVGFVVVSAFFAMQLPKATMNSDMLTYLPETMEARVNKERIEELFGGTEMIMLLIESEDVLKASTLKRVKKISSKMKRIKGIDKVMSLFELKDIRGEEGTMIVDPSVKKIPRTIQDTFELRRRIANNEIVYGNVISEDFSVTAVIGMVESGVSDEVLHGDIINLIKECPGEEEVQIGGTPHSRYISGSYTKEDIGKLLPLGLLIMLIFLFFSFRQLRGVLIPFAVVFMSILFTMGLIPLLGWNITVVTIILPVILIAVANDYGIHMIAKYQEDNLPGNTLDKKELAKRMFRSLGLPIVITGITTMAGMLCLTGHILIPAGQLGTLAAAGILFALAASLLFIPAVVSLLPKLKPVGHAGKNNGKKPILEKLLGFFGDLVAAKTKGLLVVSFVFMIVAAIGIFFVSADSDPIKYYEEDEPIAVSAKLINDKLGGSFPVSVVFKGDIKNPSILKKIDLLEKEIAEYPEVGNTLSIAKVVRQMSRVLNDKHEWGYDKIPDERNAIAQYFELYNMSGDPDDFEKMVDFDYEYALITARINTSSTPVLRKVVDRIKERVNDDPDVYLVGGISEIFSTMSLEVINGQFYSLALVLIIVTFILMVLFRSLKAGLISILPLILSIVILFGLMGLLQIELNSFTALLSSIMIGVGIDYTIHFLWRYKEERASGLLYEEAARKTLLTTGRGILFNALSVIIGFSALLLSGFVPVRFFGVLVITSIFACLVGAMIVTPSIAILFKPKFLEPVYDLTDARTFSEQESLS